MITYCRICSRPVPEAENRSVCRSCEHSMRYTLSALVDELPALVASLVPGGSTLTGSRSGARAHAPVPVDLRVLSLLGPGHWADGDDLTDVPLAAALRGWADALATWFPSHRVVGGTEHLEPFGVRRIAGGTEYLTPAGGCDAALNRGGDDVEDWAAWLTRYLPYALDLPVAADLYSDLTALLHNVRAITLTKPRTHRRLAPCPHCDAFAVVHRDSEWEVRCEACRRKIDPDEYALHAAAVMPELTAAAAVMPGLTAIAMNLPATGITQRATPTPPDTTDERDPDATPQDGQRCA
ncbi:hypothetical protein [Actinacidiphila sp. ITFR-21]|uniref:hypothetical protein n=1 Tax=Actinacidiphila sp. ITFR-21 TaxID=3075199 RepID=UPI0028895EC0|nr:hypothetical protein [Streptomyces sp. ITFR-21]WNI16634.1 hypothetical protein RLT57_14680 [Streptomyces sp. ITFR-21]